MKPKFAFLFLIITSFLISTNLFGQSTLHGVVADSLTQEALIGASVSIRGTSLGSATNIEGEYRIAKIPEGNYTVRVSYVGYKTKDISVKIGKDATINLSIQLVADVILGKELVISAQAMGQAAAINQQISSNTIMNVISEQKIQELPDANAAEAIGRLPGVALQRSGGEANKVILRGLSDRFSTFTVDGIRMAPTDADSRGVDLSTISQGSLAGIELYKALTPDKDADAIAGSVNLVTKKAPLERLIRADVKGDYNQLNKNLKQYDLAFRYGERFFDNILGIQLTGNLEQRDRSNEKVNIDYNTTGVSNGTDYEIKNITIDYINEVRKRRGFSLLTDFNTPDGGSIRFNNIYNRTDRNFTDYSRNYPLDASVSLFYTARDRQQELSTFNSSIHGDNYLFGLTANWALSFAQSLGEYPYDFEMDFLEPSSTDSQGKPASGMANLPQSVLKGPIQNIIPYALNNFSKAYLYDAYDRGQKNLDIEKTGFLDLSDKYTLSDQISGEVKLGGKYRVKNRFRENIEYLSPYYLEALRQYSVNGDGTVGLKGFAGSRFANLVKTGNSILATNFLSTPADSRNTFNLYSLNPLIDLDALHQWRDINRNGVGTLSGTDPEYRRNLEADGSYYNITERVASTYIMNTLNFGNSITFIAGYRIENENNDYKSKYSKGSLGGFPVPAGIIRDTSATHIETVYLPNFHLTFRPFEFMNVRIAVYKAIARPDFNQRLISSVSRSNGTFYTGNNLYVGNPDLKAAQAWHYEINISVFDNEIGLFSVSAFYLNITDMFHLIDGVKVNGQQILDSLGITWKQPFGTSDFNLTYPYNSSQPTKVWGFEVEHQANLRFLPGLLSNIVLSYNFSLIRSETYTAQSYIQKYFVTIPGFPFPIEKSRAVLVETKQRLEGQPEFFGNFAIGYDVGGFSGRVSIFYQGDYYNSFSGDTRNDKLTDSFTKWDLALKYQFTENFSALFNLNNFTDYYEGTSLKNQITGWRLPDTSQRYGLTADLGVRVTL